MTVIGLAVVVSAALWVRANPAPLRIGPWLATLVGALAAAVRKGPLTGPGLALVVTGVFALWGMTIQPSNDRDRQPDVARLPTAKVDPDDPSRVVIRTVRDFGPAHADRGEALSLVAGVFKNDALILTGANELAGRPRSCRTILDTCRAVVWKLADRHVPGLPIDHRVVCCRATCPSPSTTAARSARTIRWMSRPPGAACRRTSPATAPVRASPPRSGPGSLRPEPGPCRSFRSGTASGAKGRSRPRHREVQRDARDRPHHAHDPWTPQPDLVCRRWCSGQAVPDQPVVIDGRDLRFPGLRRVREECPARAVTAPCGSGGRTDRGGAADADMMGGEQTIAA